MPAANQQVADAFAVQLRESTSAQHTQLESTQLSKALLQDDVSITDYINYLLKMQPVIAFCEQDIFPRVKHIIDDIDERSKLQLIQQDLAFFNHQNTNHNHFRPVKDDISTGFALGYMYVIEGSTLGGRVILKHINNTLGITEKNGGSFFAGYELLTGSKWKHFMQTLTHYNNEYDCGEDIIEGAKHAFESIRNHFVQ